MLSSMAALAQFDSGLRPPAPRVAAADKQASEKPGEGPRDAHSDSSYVIGADDVLAINVWKEPEVSRSVPVRSDGKISLPLIGELTAGGQTPLQLEQEITKRLQNYISEPGVTVIVQDSKSQRINILGMVVRPGSYQLTNSATILDAIAMAGGFKDFAKQKSIYVLRADADGTQKRLSFNYKDVIKGKNAEQNIRLLPRDTVVVP
jgi:polysaccharide export outer membrane protein